MQQAPSRRVDDERVEVDGGRVRRIFILECGHTRSRMTLLRNINNAKRPKTMACFHCYNEFKEKHP